jgi:CubicO group peptidase (beta-lactamase class C family)
MSRTPFKGIALLSAAAAAVNLVQARTAPPPAAPDAPVSGRQEAADPAPATLPDLSTALARLQELIRAGEYRNIHGVVVLRSGATIAEWYFEGADEQRGADLGVVRFGRDTLHDTRSVSKSVVSLLFGIALARGAIRSENDPVLDYFPEYADLRTPEKSRLRLRDLLSMTSGLESDGQDPPLTDLRAGSAAGAPGADRIRAILARPLAATPGASFRYHGDDVAVIAAVIARATGMPFARFAHENLFRPLSIGAVDWPEDTRGLPLASAGLRLRPVDMARIGQLMLQKGMWEGREVVPESWVTRSTSLQAQYQPDLRCGTQYGYYWWLGVLCHGDARMPFFFANGSGGQRIWIVPAMDVVIVTTAGLYGGDDRPAEEIAMSILGAVAMLGRR